MHTQITYLHSSIRTPNTSTENLFPHIQNICVGKQKTLPFIYFPLITVREGFMIPHSASNKPEIQGTCWPQTSTNTFVPILLPQSVH
jgi:hypothetical protein